MGCVVEDNQESVPGLSTWPFSPRPFFTEVPLTELPFTTLSSPRDLGLSVATRL